MDLQRVKVYKLNDEGTWDDTGTGHVTVEYLEHALMLIVTSEADSATLLAHSISRNNAYQRQGDDTIITWSDADVGTDVALSFQEAAGCNRIWRQIQELQGSNAGAGGGNMSDEGSPTDSGGSPRGSLHRGMVDEFDGVPCGPSGMGPYDDGMIHTGMPSIDLPEPTLGALPDIAKVLTDASPFQRDTLAAQMLTAGYLTRLMACFRTAEDLEDDDAIAAAHATAKAAVLLNDTALLETLFSEDYVWDLIGALEADPEVPAAARAGHREYLRGEGAPREVVPIQDPLLRAKIHVAHRMGYVKDAVLPRALDDATFATLSSLQLFNNVEVLLALQQDPHFFPGLFARLKETPSQSQEWRDLVGFLQELTSLARNLQAVQRNALLGSLAELGLFESLAEVLAVGDDASRLRAADVLLAAVSHDPAPLRAFLLSEGAGKALFAEIVSALLRPSAVGLQEQAAEVLRVLLDPETMENSVEKDRFIDVFYEQHIASLHDAVQKGAPGNSDGSNAPQEPSAATLILIIELLCYCVTHHSYRIKYFVLRNNVVDKVLRLLRRSEIAVGAAALRFLRTCVGMRDEFYNRYLVKNELLEPVIVAFLANGKRYNLLNSAALELFDFLRKENLKGLVSAVVESPQWGRLEGETSYVDTMRMLRVRYESNQEGRGAGGAGGSMGGGGGGGAGGPGGSAGGAHVDASRGGDAAGNGMHISMGDAEFAARQRREAAAEARRRRGEREEDADEENYFREDDDDDDDDDDDEQNAAPRQKQPQGHVGIGSSGASGREGIAGGQVVLESFSPLPGMPLGRLVDYDDDDDEDTLPLGAFAKRDEVQKRTAAVPAASPPTDKRPRTDGGPTHADPDNTQ